MINRHAPSLQVVMSIFSVYFSGVYFNVCTEAPRVHPHGRQAVQVHHLPSQLPPPATAQTPRDAAHGGGQPHLYYMRQGIRAGNKVSSFL